MIDQDLQNAYEKAVYRIFKPSISWKVGNYCPELDELLLTHDVAQATFITAYNPKSIPLPSYKNRSRNIALAMVLDEAGYTYLEGQGEDPEDIWLAEASYLVLGMSPTQALIFGRQFEQNAILIIAKGEIVRLLSCTD